MRRVFRLPILVLIVWVAFAGLLALLAVMVAAQAWHPHFLPATALLFVLIASGLALLVGGVWRMIRGPGRLRAMTYLLLGTVPLLAFTGYILYGLKAGYGRQVEINLSLKMLVPFGESIFDLLSRFQYPIRTEGETVVMLSTPMPNAREQVAAMDRHVRSLWDRLGGRAHARRVHWVRGPLLGIGGHAMYGMCMGSQPGDLPADAEGLTSLDRHEVAHCVIDSFMPTDINPPALLSEGWAQANMGQDAKAVALQAWEYRERGSTLSLNETGFTRLVLPPPLACLLAGSCPGQPHPPCVRAGKILRALRDMPTDDLRGRLPAHPRHQPRSARRRLLVRDRTNRGPWKLSHRAATWDEGPPSRHAGGMGRVSRRIPRQECPPHEAL